MALYGDTLAVGAFREDSNQTTITNGTTSSTDNSAADAGAVYVYKRTGTSWAQEAYIKAANAGANDFFGRYLSIYGDTLAVSSYGEDSNQSTITNGTGASTDNSASLSGAVYVYKRNGTTWSQEAYIKAANTAASNVFGRAVSIDVDTLAVGASGENSNATTITNGTIASTNTSNTSSGAVYVYKRTYRAPTWSQQAYIKAVNAEASDKFGAAVSLSLDTLVVGAHLEASNQTTITNGTAASTDNSLSGSGAAYVYKRSGTNWAQEAYIKPISSTGNDNFGDVLSINRDTIVVGAHLEDSNLTTITNGTTASTDNSASAAGAAYVYKRTGTSWAQEAFIKAENAQAGDYFGYDVSVSADTLAVGVYREDSNLTTITNGTTTSADNSATESGAVYVYKRRNVSTWVQEAYVKASNAETNDYFGYAVSNSGDTIAVGAYQEDSNLTTITNGATSSADNSTADSGAVYIYKRTGATWAQEAYIKAANADASDNFGYAVAINRDTLVVGSLYESSNQTSITNGTSASTDNSGSSPGAAYVYRRTGTTWAQEAFVKAANANSNDSFGYSVSVSGDTIAVGAPDESSGQTTITNGTTASTSNSAASAGAVYVYKRSGTSWAQEAYIKAANAEASDTFGRKISLDGDSLAVGAWAEASNQTTITNGTTASTNNSVADSGAVYIYVRN